MEAASEEATRLDAGLPNDSAKTSGNEPKHSAMDNRRVCLLLSVCISRRDGI